MGNTYWTEEDERLLLDLYNDLLESTGEKPKLVEVARKAGRYRMFPGRTENAIMVRLSHLLNSLAKPTGEEYLSEQMEFNLYKGQYEKLRDQMGGFLTELSKGLEKYPNGAPKWLYSSVTRAAEKFFPEWLAAQLDNIGPGDDDDE